MKTKTILLVFVLFGLSIFFQADHPDANGPGVKYIKAGDERIPVTEAEYYPFSGYLNTTYMIERNEITLQNGRCEIPSAPDSATKIRTSVYGDVVEGDLDGDGDRDAILILLHDPGGSGTFYYLTIGSQETRRHWKKLWKNTRKNRRMQGPTGRYSWF